MAVSMIRPQSERSQQAGDGVIPVVHIGEYEREIDQVICVLRIEPDCLLPHPQRVLHAIRDAVQRAEIGVPTGNAGPQSHGAFQHGDAALWVIGMRRNHPQQGERRCIVGRGRQHVVADAGRLTEALGLCGGLGARERLIDRLGCLVGGIGRRHRGCTHAVPPIVPSVQAAASRGHHEAAAHQNSGRFFNRRMGQAQ